MLKIRGKFNSLAGVSYIGLIGCSSILFLLLTAFILMPSFTENQATAINNDSGFSTYSTTTTPSVSISLPDSIVFSEVVPTPDGSTTTASTSFSVVTTESDGYSLYLYSDGDGSLKSSNPANISSIIATQGDVGLTLSSLKPNTWGYNLGTAAPDGNTTYIGVPTDSATPIQTKDTSTTGQADDTYTLAFGAKVDNTIPSGSYSNTLTMAVIAEPQSIVEKLPAGIDPDIYTSTNPGVVDVYPTTGWGGDVIAITSDGQFSEVTDVTIGGTSCTPYQVVNEYLIACKLPTKAANTNDGYEVAVTTNTGDIDMHNFTIRYFDPASTSSMQSFTETTCGSMSIGDVVSLVDERNDQTYRVRKMENNTCWMIDSMKYLGEEVAISNVDGTSGIIYNNTSGYRNTVNGTSTQSSANFDKAFYNNPMGQAYCYSSDASSSYTKCGYLYNWYAATAGSGTYNLDTDGANATASICPAGWELPAMEDYNNLSYALDLADWQTSGKWSGMLSGYWNTSGTFAQLSTNGYYWSSTAYSSYNARDFYYKTNSVVLTDNSSKIAGFAVRCTVGEPTKPITISFDGNGADSGSMSSQMITPGATKRLTPNGFVRMNYAFDSWNTSADGSGTSYANEASYTAPAESVTLYAQWRLPINHLGEVTYMQDLTTTHCSTSENGAKATLIDRRDNNSYTIAKINGNCWMTQNLRIAGGTTLTPSTSNVASNYTIPTTDLTSGESITEGKIHNSGNTTYGYWYNLCAASAGTVCNEEPVDATYSICPKGWQLPTTSELRGLEYALPLFSPVTGGYFSGNRLLHTTDTGAWWSSNADAGKDHFAVYYREGDNGDYHYAITIGFDHDKSNGFYVRCVKSD